VINIPIDYMGEDSLVDAMNTGFGEKEKLYHSECI
jgi:hypothetical protein